MLLLLGCNSDDVQLPDRQLGGQIGGSEWNYKSANGYLISTDLQYQVRFLSDEETVTDPCTLPVPSRSHIRAVFRPSVGNFFITPQVINNNEVQASFEVSPSQSLTATNGFMEIFAIENQRAIGYLQAVLDDENTVEGSFEIRLCN